MQINQNKPIISKDQKIDNISQAPLTEKLQSTENNHVNNGDSACLSVNRNIKAETNISFVDENTNNKYSAAVEKVAAKLKAAKSPEDKKSILDSFKNSLNTTTTTPSMGILGDGIGVYSESTSFDNKRLRPFIKYAKSQIAEADKAENITDKELYKQILKTIKEARGERFQSDSPTPGTKVNLFSL